MNKKRQQWLIYMAILTLSSFLVLRCGSNGTGSVAPVNEDNSASGVVASAVSGAISNSDSNGTLSYLDQKKPNALYASILEMLLPNAYAATTCPTFKTLASSCTASGSTMWITLSSCVFTSNGATWNGTMANIMSSGTASCGTFPLPGASSSLVRQWVTGASSTTPSTATITTATTGVVKTIDHATANLNNFNTDTISTSSFANSGYGTSVSYGANKQKTGMTVGQRIFATKGSTKLYDMSIITGTAANVSSLTITETAGATSRTVSGTVTVYHNILQVIGTTTLTNVVHTNTCCMPTSGSMTTSFAAGSNVAPTTAGSKLVGKSETLTFTACGVATLVDTSGKSTNVNFTHCG